MSLKRWLVASAAALALAGCGGQNSTVTSGGSAAAVNAVSSAAPAARRARGTAASGSTSARASTFASASASASASAGAFGLITEPAQGVTPFTTAITHARRSADLVMYELTDRTVEGDLVADAHRGVAVRVLLDGGYHGAGASINQPAYAYLKANRVPVRWSPSYFALTHQKTLIVDGRAAYIMTLNLTPQYYASSRDFAVLDRQPADLRSIEQAFAADWTATRTTASSATDLVWSPGALDAELGLIESAHASVDIYNEEMDQPQIEQALEADGRRGVNVRVVMTASSEWDSAFAALSAAGVHVRTYAADASLYIHAKMILVDGRRVFLGSQNFSTGSLEDNRELGIIFTVPSILGSLRGTFDDDYDAAQPFSQRSSSGPSSSGSSSSGSSSRPSSGSPQCTASAAYSDRYHDYDVYVRSNQPDATVMAVGAGTSATWHTDSSGTADVYFKASASAAGQTVNVQVGAATCSATL